jgi:hypothetical protein
LAQTREKIGNFQAILGSFGMRGRPRKPVENHLRDGTYRADRHGPIPDEEPAGPPPAKPKDLTGVAEKFWNLVVALVGPTLRAADAPQLVQMCRWWARWKECEQAIDELAEGVEPGSMQYTRLLNSAVVCSANFDRVASRFGLTPADRAKLRAEAAPPTRARVATRPATRLDQKGAPSKPKVKRARRGG